MAIFEIAERFRKIDFTGTVSTCDMNYHRNTSARQLYITEKQGESKNLLFSVSCLLSVPYLQVHFSITKGAVCWKMMLLVVIVIQNHMLILFSVYRALFSVLVISSLRAVWYFCHTAKVILYSPIKLAKRMSLGWKLPPLAFYLLLLTFRKYCWRFIFK